MSIRGEILDNIKTALETISIANGYNQDLGLVEDKILRAPDDTNTDDFPALYIIDADEDKERRGC